MVRLALSLGLLVIGTASAARAETAFPQCHAAFDRLLADEVFGRYPAPVPAAPLTPVPPDVRRGTARLYRTVIREGAKQPPNFAGHYVLIRIGCGAGTVCPAILDANSGKVVFPSGLRNASSLLLDTGDTDVETLNYRKDSRLLIVFGTPNEDERKNGMSYYLWQSGQLKLMRFVPTTKICGTH